MSARGKLITLLLWILICIAATPGRASAYTDPGSGAMLWQLMAVTFLSSAFYVRKTVRWIRNFFSMRKDEKKMQETGVQG